MTELYRDNGFVYFRNKKGLIQKVKENQFSDGEIVMRSDKHHSRSGGLIQVVSPKYNKMRGWIYIEHYVDLQGSGGGSSMWNEERLYKKIDNPILKLYAERIKLKREIRKLYDRLHESENICNTVEDALKIAVPDWDEVVNHCPKCDTLFIRNTHNVNLDICDKCWEKENDRKNKI